MDQTAAVKSTSKAFFQFLFSLVFCLVASCQIASAQLTQTIKGRVVDKESKSPLSGATVVLLGKPKGSICDTDGNFKLLVPVGRVTIKVSYAGYETATIPDIEVATASTNFINVELRESVNNQLHQVNIVSRATPLNPRAMVSVRTINAEDASRYAGGYGDPARSVSSFAGVVASGGSRNDIVIRGNSPRELQWKLDGIEIPSPNHFTRGQGDGGGVYGIISTDMLSNSDFYTGAFPAQYGNAIAGIMDLSMRKGDITNTHFSFQAADVGLQGSIEGPIKGSPGSSFLFNYRYANFQPLHKWGLISLDANQKAPIFQDVALNVNIKTKAAGDFTLFGIGGISTTGNTGVRDSTQWGGTKNISLGNAGSSTLRKDNTEDHSMAALGLEHTLNFNDKATFIKTVLALTYEYNAVDDGKIIARQDSAQYPGLVSGKGYARAATEVNSFSFPSLKLATVLNHKFSARNTLRVGITLSGLEFAVSDVKFNQTKTTAQHHIVNDTLVNSSGSSAMAEAFAEWKHRISGRWEINGGLHGTYFALNSHNAIEPRLGSRLQLSEKSFFSYSFGLHSRIEPLSSYYSLVRQANGTLATPNKQLNFTRSVHNVVGYDWLMGDNLRFKAEAYYEYLFDVPVRASASSSESVLNFQYGMPDTTYNNAGKGYNKGLEFTFERTYSNNYYILVTASFYDSKYRAGNGVLYSTYYNGQYVLNWLAGKDFNMGKTKQNVLGLNFRVLLRGGSRYAGQQVGAKGILIITPYAMQVAPFFSFDTGIKYRQNLRNYSWIISLDVENTTNKKNILYNTTSLNSKQTVLSISPTYGLGIVPILNFKVQF